MLYIICVLCTFIIVRRCPDALRRASDVVMAHYLVDDEAFPLSRHLMRPCPRAGQVGPEADDRRIFQQPPESGAALGRERDQNYTPEIPDLPRHPRLRGCITDLQGWSQHPHPSGGPCPEDADGLR